MALKVSEKIEGYLICNVCVFMRFMDYLPNLLAKLPLDNECIMETFERHEEFQAIYSECRLKKDKH